MKNLVLAVCFAFVAVAYASDDDGNVMKHDGNVIKPKATKDKFVSDDMREAMGGDGKVSVEMSTELKGMNQIEGKCEDMTKDAISVKVPCRDLELILKMAGKTVDKVDLDPRGGFMFEKLSPNYTYTLFVRKKTSTHVTQMEGLKTGRIYTFSMSEVK